ncbi:hypothetical protein CMI37_00835 [Candidatus Pacearchaeota archaeon]|nr:hypothetical protein [Candidatus Pacearchaeota archaeon]|tara:strand:- start:5882 stop:6211 length:330 start_codon:yes stop_codon:yes gene_type:complete
MIYVFDIDGTICTDTGGEYEKALPIVKRINKVNELYDTGNTIIYFTARGMGRSGNNMHFAYNKYFSLTRGQLFEWGAKFHQLILGKPAGDIYIDDKGIKDEDFFANEAR